VITPSGRALLVGGAVAVVAGVVLAVWPFVAVGLVLLGTVGAARILVRGAGDLEYERTLDRERVTLGETALAELRVRNHGKRRVSASRAIEPAGNSTIETSAPALGVKLPPLTGCRCKSPSSPKWAWMRSVMSATHSGASLWPRTTKEDTRRPTTMKNLVVMISVSVR